MKHGTSTGYIQGQCRCEECKSWKVADNEQTVQLAKYRDLPHGKNSTYRYGCRCDECREAKRLENALMNPRRKEDVRSERSLKKPMSSLEYSLRKYGITLLDFNRMNEEQAGKCALCFSFPDTERLFVDHCHETGRVRGLLCRKCNTTLGFARDDADLLRRMANYVE